MEQIINRQPNSKIHNINFIPLFLIIICTTLLYSCGGSYNIGSKSFSSAEDALAYKESTFVETLNEIKPITDNAKSYGNILIVMPTRETIENNYLKFTGDVSSLSRDQIDFLITSVIEDHNVMCRVIEKRQLFNKLSKVLDPNPASVEIKENDFLLYKNIGAWFLKGKNSESPKEIIIDTSLPLGVPRTMSFLKSLEIQANEILKE